MNKFWVIALDVYKKNIKSISFLIMILVPFIASGAFYLIGYFADGMNSVDKIAVYANEPAIAQTFVEQSGDDFEFEIVDSKEQGQQQLADKDADALLVITASGDTLQGELLSESSMGQALELTIQQLLTGLQSSYRASELGLTAEQVAVLSEVAPLDRQKVSFDENGEMTHGEDNTAMQSLVSMIATIILFFFIITYAQIIAQEIASEKGTRIMEV
ncbi:ABC transporter permease, partial [Listeria monocytogenes]|nr:ABC transporter permease [Listeria monocytogenes]